MLCDVCFLLELSYGVAPRAMIAVASVGISPGHDGHTWGIDDGFVALRSDGTLHGWGEFAAADLPTSAGFVDIFTSSAAVTARRGDGTLTTWGNATSGAGNAPCRYA